jgi:Sporulation and spore germination/Immunoglobulin-like domain of bacterial spore germination
MLDGSTAYDPDYASAWPASAAVRGVQVAGGIAIVDLSGAAVNGAGDAEARLAVQQLVWTATAVTGVTGVQVRLDGAPVDRLWGRVDVSGTVRRAAAADVIGLVWLIGPQHFSTVGRTFEVHVAGIVFEATAQLRVRQGTQIVAERVLTLSSGAPAQGETRLNLTLPPGTYVLEAYEISAEDGSEQHLDDHTVTVR